VEELEKIINELNCLPTTVYCGFYQLRMTHSLRDEVVKLLKEQQEQIEKLEETNAYYENEMFNNQ